MTRPAAWIRILGAASVAALLLSQQAGAGDLPCPPGTDRLGEYRVFFGRSGAGGAEVVGDDDWRDFLEEVVTPRFPDGLTVQDAQGQWRDTAGLILSERSKVLVLFAPAGQDSLSKVGEIAAEYRERFRQESVLVAVGSACVSFGM